MEKDTYKTILVTGGTGFIGSHICVELLMNGFEVVVVDNLSNSDEVVVKRITEITGKSIVFYNTDVRNRAELENIFSKHKIQAVIHCAGLKSVKESVENPLLYYDNNVYGSIVLIQTMGKYDVKKIVFSSSACVYEADAPVPYVENTPVRPVNPYGKTKLYIEEILHDVAASGSGWSIALLRYFNPIGAHPSGLIGEDPKGAPNNLMPYICQVAVGTRPELLIFGDDYETLDGTGIRDYIHVVDLAIGHIKALARLESNQGVLTANLGVGKGTSVLELIEAFSRVSGRVIPYKIVARRTGDIPVSYANTKYAEKELNWSATRTIDEACRDAWRWQRLNPGGYK